MSPPGEARSVGKSAGPSAKKSKRKAKSSKLASSATGNVVENGEKFRTLTLRKSPDHDYQPRDIQVSSDLVEWSSGEDHTTVIVDGSRVLSVRDNTPVRPGMKRYIRLRPSAR